MAQILLNLFGLFRVMPFDFHSRGGRVGEDGGGEGGAAGGGKSL